MEDSRNQVCCWEAHYHCRGSADNIANVENGEWNQANAYLADGQNAKARTLLQQIAANPDHSYHDDAVALLERLDSFWRKLSW